MLSQSDRKQIWDMLFRAVEVTHKGVYLPDIRKILVSMIGRLPNYEPFSADDLYFIRRVLAGDPFLEIQEHGL